MIRDTRFTPPLADVRSRCLSVERKRLWMREVLVDSVPVHTLERWRGQLDDDERRRADRLISEDRRKEVVAAHGLLRDLAGHIADVEPSLFRLDRAYAQKPRLLADSSLALDVNLTHCPAFAACVVSRQCDVGIDAEDLFRPVSAKDLLPHFAREEQQWLNSLAPSRADSASLQLWSLKEAALKAIGRGLSIDLSAFSLLPKQGRLLRSPDIFGDPAGWRFWQFYPTNRHVVSIAARAAEAIA